MVSNLAGPTDTAFLTAEMGRVQALGAPMLPAGEDLSVALIRGTTLLQVRVEGPDLTRCDASMRRILQAYVTAPRSDAKLIVQSYGALKQ